MTAVAGQEKRSIRPRMSNGTGFVIGLVAMFGFGWLLYRTTIPPTWLRDFGVEIALRATPDPTAPPPEDSRQVTPRGLAETPYICAGHVIRLPWDRLVVVTSAAEARSQTILADADWTTGAGAEHSLDTLAEKLQRDPRYQAIVLLDGGKVLSTELFFTFWADLGALARVQGFSPADAIFTAAVKNGTYVLSVPEDVPADACK